MKPAQVIILGLAEIEIEIGIEIEIASDVHFDLLGTRWLPEYDHAEPIKCATYFFFNMETDRRCDVFTLPETGMSCETFMVVGNAHPIKVRGMILYILALVYNCKTALRFSLYYQVKMFRTCLTHRRA